VGSVIITLVAGFPVFLKGNWSTPDFIASYVGIPIFVVPIIGWKLYHKTKVSQHLLRAKALLTRLRIKFLRAQQIDLWSGRLHFSEIPPARPKPSTVKGHVQNFFA
jgi:amino acid transporter